MKVGGHLSVAGGYTNALTKTIEIGGNALQIFASSPRIWAPLIAQESTISDFVALKHTLKIDPIYFHASYLINMADAGFIGLRSRQRILDELILAEKMEIKGTIIHLGSYKETDKLLPVSPEKYQILLRNISWVLEKSNSPAFFIIENAGNRKIGWNIDEIAGIISDLRDDRVKVCIDTCHMHAAGYDISSKEKFDAFFTDFDRKIGMERLEVFQVNDSKDPLGSFHDRHENIGNGMIPSQVFKLLLNEEITKDKPFILEVPGVEKKGPDKEQVDVLKNFLQNP